MRHREHHVGEIAVRYERGGLFCTVRAPFVPKSGRIRIFPQSHTQQLVRLLSQTTLKGLLTALHQLGSLLHLNRCRQGDKGEHHSTDVD